MKQSSGKMCNKTNKTRPAFMSLISWSNESRPRNSNVVPCVTDVEKAPCESLSSHNKSIELMPLEFWEVCESFLSRLRFQAHSWQVFLLVFHLDGVVWILALVTCASCQGFELQMPCFCCGFCFLLLPGYCLCRLKLLPIVC